MPLPTQKSGEDRKDFISRCMSDDTMKKEYPQVKNRISVCVKQAKEGKASLIEEVQTNLLATNCSWDDEWNELTWEIEAFEIYDEDGKALGAEYQGRKVTLNKPFLTPKAVSYTHLTLPTTD